MSLTAETIRMAYNNPHGVQQHYKKKVHFSDIVSVRPAPTRYPLPAAPLPAAPVQTPVHVPLDQFLQSVTEPRQHYPMPSASPAISTGRRSVDSFEEEYRRNRYGRFSALEEFKGLG
jgi:hypothetical protein